MISRLMSVNDGEDEAELNDGGGEDSNDGLMMTEFMKLLVLACHGIKRNHNHNRLLACSLPSKGV
jgi:hypothetical protein